MESIKPSERVISYDGIISLTPSNLLKLMFECKLQSVQLVTCFSADNYKTYNLGSSPYMKKFRNLPPTEYQLFSNKN